MKNILTFLFICIGLWASSQVRMPDSVAVYIKTESLLSSKTIRYGQELEFTVTRDVVVDDQVIIEAGAKAFGVVTQAAKADLLGDPGMLEIQMDVVEGVSQDYPISGPKLFSQGKDRQTVACVLAVVVTPLFLLLKGQQAKIFPTTEIEVFLGNPTSRRGRVN